MNCSTPGLPVHHNSPLSPHLFPMRWSLQLGITDNNNVKMENSRWVAQRYTGESQPGLGKPQSFVRKEIRVRYLSREREERTIKLKAFRTEKITKPQNSGITLDYTFWGLTMARCCSRHFCVLISFDSYNNEVGVFIYTGFENSGPKKPGHSPKISSVMKAQLRVQPKPSDLGALLVHNTGSWRLISSLSRKVCGWNISRVKECGRDRKGFSRTFTSSKAQPLATEARQSRQTASAWWLALMKARKQKAGVKNIHQWP